MSIDIAMSNKANLKECFYSNQCEDKKVNCELTCIDYTPNNPTNPDNCLFMSQNCESCYFINYCFLKFKRL